MKDSTIDSATLPEREQEILDTALLESDQLLARSLHDDDRRRRRRFWWLSILAIGGVVMSGFLVALLAGWLTVSGQVLAGAENNDATKEEQEQIQAENLAWQKRLRSASNNDPWHVGANIGMDLVRIPGDRPYELLEANWKKIAVDVRKQILKGFTPGMMGNKKTHPRFFDVMHLGMSDTAGGVRGYAAAYLEMQGLPNFEHDLASYKRWREETKDLSAKEISQRAKAGEFAPSETQTAADEPLDEAQKAALAEQTKREDLRWKKRLLSIKQDAPWHVGANVGMDLVRIPGDRPYEILSAHWKKIPASARKQILKGFTPGMMGNKKMHPRFFDVMHLGMSDNDAEVRSYAATYLEMQGLPDFEQKLDAYKRWRQETADLAAKEIMQRVNNGS